MLDLFYILILLNSEFYMEHPIFFFSFWCLGPLNDLIIAWAKGIPGKKNNMRRELQEEQHSWSENLEVRSGK